MAYTIYVSLLATVIVLVVLAMEVRDLKRGALILCLAMMVLGAIYGLLGAVYVMVLQLLVYGGAVTVLLIALITITRGRFEE
jgi:NADH:ubiquinone oxidoreductase subunit 6 (subunit J)